MASFLDDCFAKKIPVLIYSWTWTDTGYSDPASDLGTSVAFATGALQLSHISHGHAVDMSTRKTTDEIDVFGSRRYIDSKVDLWGAEGLRMEPPAFKRRAAPDYLIVQPSGTGVIITYGKHSDLPEAAHMDYYDSPPYNENKAVFFASRANGAYFGMCLVLQYTWAGDF